MRLVIPLISLTAMVALYGCSGNKSDNPLSPGDPAIEQNPPSSQTSYDSSLGRSLLGLWQISVSDDHESIEIHPQRLAESHFNAVKYLEEGPCTDCLSANIMWHTDPNIITLYFYLKHPVTDNIGLTAYDVRGIFISEADFTFPYNNRSVNLGDEFPRLLNPDGFTSLFNPTEFPDSDNVPDMRTYYPGSFATGGDLTSTLNPFVAYDKKTARRSFEPGTHQKKEIDISVPDGSFEFGYAVDFSWAPRLPNGKFPPEANCNEAFEVNVEVEANLRSGAGSTVRIQAEVFDHQSEDTPRCYVEAPGLFDGEVELDLITQELNSFDNRYVFSGNLVNETSAGYGEYPVLVRVEDDAEDPNLGKVDAWQVDKVNVSDGWTRSWGGSDSSYYGAVATDESGNSYVLSKCLDETDYDPGLDVAGDYPEGTALTKFDSDGNFQWVKVWRADHGSGIALDPSGNIYVTGWFEGSCDFDPGPGEVSQYAVGLGAYILKLNPDGEFLWVRSWGGISDEKCNDINIDTEGNIYVTGFFTHHPDFDPGPGETILWSNGDMDVFLSKFDQDGNFQWARTWGSEPNGSDATDISFGVISDSSGGHYVTGFFNGIVDFDPGPGTYELEATYGAPFLSKFDSDGNFLWALSWVSWVITNTGNLMAVDAGDNIYLAESSRDWEVDYDPGPGEELHNSPGMSLSKFNSDGEFQWVKFFQYNGYGLAVATDVEVDAQQNIFVSGSFFGEIDLDPGPGVDLKYQPGYEEYERAAFIASLDSVGEYRWGAAWDTTTPRSNVGIIELACAPDNSIYATGFFFEEPSDHGPLDLDPGSNVDLHQPILSKAGCFLAKFNSDGTW